MTGQQVQRGDPPSPATARSAGSVSVLREDLGHSCHWKRGWHGCKRLKTRCPGSCAQRFLSSLKSQTEPARLCLASPPGGSSPPAAAGARPVSKHRMFGTGSQRRDWGRLAASVRIPGPGDFLMENPVGTGGCKHTAVLSQAPAKPVLPLALPGGVPPSVALPPPYPRAPGTGFGRPEVCLWSSPVC